MTQESDIGTRLFYTCNCGWVDMGHVETEATNVKTLLDEIRKQSAHPKPGEPGFQVDYQQSMGRAGIRVGANGNYLVRYGLSPDQQNAAALGILQDVTVKFETLQLGSIWPWLTHGSGFSQEDLVSDLIGFHAALRGEGPHAIVDRLCKKVSNETARKVWVDAGAVGDNKNKKWTPLILGCQGCAKECAGQPRAFPAELGSVTPAKKGAGLEDLRKGKATFYEIVPPIPGNIH